MELMGGTTSPMLEFRGVAMLLLSGPLVEVEQFSAADRGAGGVAASSPLVAIDVSVELGAMTSILSVDESPGVDADCLLR